MRIQTRNFFTTVTSSGAESDLGLKTVCRVHQTLPRGAEQFSKDVGQSSEEHRQYVNSDEATK